MGVGSFELPDCTNVIKKTPTPPDWRAAQRVLFCLLGLSLCVVAGTSSVVAHADLEQQISRMTLRIDGSSSTTAIGCGAC